MTQPVTSGRSGADRSMVSARPRPAWALAAVELFVGLNAVYGGWKLIEDGFGLPAGWLSHTPLHDWTWPGVALIAGVAVPQLAAAIVVVTTSRRRPAVGYRLGLAVGAALVLWIMVQLALLQRYFFLQPVIAGLGLAEVALALRWRHLSRRR